MVYLENTFQLESGETRHHVEARIRKDPSGINYIFLPTGRPPIESSWPNGKWFFNHIIAVRRSNAIMKNPPDPANHIRLPPGTAQLLPHPPSRKKKTCLYRTVVHYVFEVSRSHVSSG